MYQDTYIEYWGEIFVSARIIEFGITFERFLKDPWKHLMSCGQESAPDAIAEGMLPLLPAQAEVARRIRESDLTNQIMLPRSRTSSQNVVINMTETSKLSY
ncbi:hypothetical protein [Vibrio parahaemolyticus]|uniref:hypothetical protein n=2 Tax=Vibrio TaxID=662 RepID=UPI002852C570|nr:hypothetical protein [Vibrio parahaemolyticus]